MTRARRENPSANLPDLQTREWLDLRWSWLCEQFGQARVRGATVVLPTVEFFPDPYDHGRTGAEAMLRRVAGYLGVDDRRVELEFYEDRNPLYRDGLRQGAAGLFEEIDAGRYRVWLEANKLDHPPALLATLTHELGHAVLLGERRVDPDVDEDHEPLTDLLTVFFGLGVCTSNAVVVEQSYQEGQMAHWRIERQGYLTMPMFGYALALFARSRNECRPAWASQLRADVRAAFEASMRLLEQPVGPRTQEESREDIHDEQSDIEAEADDDGSPADSSSEVDSDSQEVESEHATEGNPSTVPQLVARYRAGERRFRFLDMMEQDLSDVDLRGAELFGADFSDAVMRNACFDQARLEKAELPRADLQGASFQDADLHHADLRGANLSDVDLTGADLRGADFRGARMAGAKLYRTRRDEQTRFEDVDLDEVLCDTDVLAVARGSLSPAAVGSVAGEVVRGLIRIALRLFIGGMFAAFLAILGMLAGEVVGKAMGVRDFGERVAIVCFGVSFVVIQILLFLQRTR